MRMTRALPRAHRRAAARVLAPAMAACLALSACGGGEEKKPDEEPSSSESAAPAEPETWPLTGLELPEGESAARTHPVYIAKIDNTTASDPQYGLGKADLVVEELVEGGITRLAVFFYSQLPKKVGPVRSMRLTDIGIAKPVGAQLVTSGAAPVTLDGLKKAGITWIDMNNEHVVRQSDGSHDTLHSVVADLAAIGKDADGDDERPADYLPWGDPAAFPQGQPATDVSVRLSAARTSDWVFKGGTYHLQDGGGQNGNYMAKGDEFTPDTLVVATVHTTLAPYKDPVGSDVPVSHFEGKGPAMIFHDGRLVRATWEKKSEDAAISFTTKAGEITLPPGKVWIELVPGPGGAVAPGSVTFGR